MGSFLWFIAGAGAATWWSKHQAMRQQQSPYEPSGNPLPQHQHNPSRGYRSDKDWEEQRARFREMSRQAGETAIDVSEATLDALLVAVQTLREKLAERQTMRSEARAQHSQALPPKEQTPDLPSA